MTTAPVLLERDGSVARLVLNRPDAGNAIDLALARCLLEHAIACDQNPAIRCVVLTARGRLFCAGGDVAAISGERHRMPAFLSELAGVLHMAVSRLARMAKPLLVLVNGPAAGAGLSLALLGDIVLARRSAHFTVAYGAIGLTPDGGASWLLPRLVGLRRAQELVVTNRRVPVDEAVAIGLITRMVEEEAFAAEGEAMARQLAAGATAAIGAARGLLLQSLGNGLETQMELEARTIAAAGGGAEAREGIAAFLDKRKADFEGVS
ncbi:MAG: enoyl-CoA hydratase/isomerase family protein [Zavarzinia sp.]|nr:enoyl-CoA hydratase/isomerase family protein [Zavarzinia sp.]